MSKEAFKSRVMDWATRLDVKVHALSVRPMRNKWASCSTAGNLSFNVELLSYGTDVADYVIVHELLHFYVPNHGRLWKSLMRAHLGDYEQLEAPVGEQLANLRSQFVISSSEVVDCTRSVGTICVHLRNLRLNHSDDSGHRVGSAPKSPRAFEAARTQGPA